MLKCLRKKGGFTLIEMLIVLLIIGFLVAMLAIRASDAGDAAKKRATAGDLKKLKEATEAFYVAHGRFPAVGTWEEELVDEKTRLLDEVPVDPYDGTNDYKYLLNTDAPAGKYYVIYSVGPDEIGGSPAVTALSTTGNYRGKVAVGGPSADNLYVSNCYVDNHKFD